MADEVKVWEPKHPRLAAIGEFLKQVAESSALGDFLLGGKADLATKLAYDEPLTTGKGMTTGVKPVAMEATDFIPSGTLAKGAGKAVIIGGVGLKNLGDKQILERYERLMEALKKTKPKDWELQKNITEQHGFIPIPRGRDIDPTSPTIKVGYHIPEGSTPTYKLMDAVEGASPRALKQWMTFKDAFEEPARLLRAYPSMETAQVHIIPNKKSGTAAFNPETGNIELARMDPITLDYITRHEQQHAVQALENWPGGTNANIGDVIAYRAANAMPDETYLRRIAKANKDLTKRAKASLDPVTGQGPDRELGYDMYLREAGEQLADRVGRAGTHTDNLMMTPYTTDFHKMYDMRVAVPDVAGMSMADILRRY